MKLNILNIYRHVLFLSEMPTYFSLVIQLIDSSLVVPAAEELELLGQFSGGYFQYPPPPR